MVAVEQSFIGAVQTSCEAEEREIDGDGKAKVGQTIKNLSANRDLTLG